MIIRAIKRDVGWVLIDSTGRVIGEETPYIFSTRKEAYKYCSDAWPINGVWLGHKVHDGYYIREE